MSGFVYKKPDKIFFRKQACYKALALIKLNNQKWKFDFKVKCEITVCKQPATTHPKIDNPHESPRQVKIS